MFRAEIKHVLTELVTNNYHTNNSCNFQASLFRIAYSSNYVYVRIKASSILNVNQISFTLFLNSNGELY